MSRTTDRAQSDVYTVQTLGRTQEMTPEGFLLCRDVPIARVGEMLYSPNDGLPVKPGRDFLVRITRDESVLLHQDTLASFEGKAITIDHPDEDVGPDNWSKLSKGFARNVRIGENELAGHMIADLLVMDKSAITQVRDGLREVSLGYDAEYADDGGGRGRQVSITGNHIALVERGRCGPVCSIGDSEMKTRDKSQKTQDKKSWMDRMKAAFYTKDEDAFVKELEGAPDVADIDGDDKTHNIVINLNGGSPEPAAAIAADPVLPVTDPAAVVPPDPNAAIMTMLESINTRLTALEGGSDDDDGDGIPDEEEEVETKDSDDEDEDETKTKDKKTLDSASLAEEFSDTVARAEILSPGIKIPTFDSKLTKAKTVDQICGLRRRALQKVAEEHSASIAPLLKGVDLKKSTCDSIRTTFIAASEIVSRKTNDSQFVIRRPVRDSEAKGIPSIADINKRNREFWDAKTK